MNEKSIRLVTAESVRAGHPDKLCDQIADATLDAYLEQDPKAKVAVEVLATKNAIAIVGEVTSTGKVDFNEILVDAFNRIGYKAEDLGMKPGKPIKTAFLVHEQSPDIAAAVDKNQEIGAGDQGIMVGYATDETHEYMPLPVVLAHQICKRLDKLKRNYSWMGADGKAQVTVVYEDEAPVAVDTIVVSVQHSAEINRKGLKHFIRNEVIEKIIPPELLRKDTRILVNPSGCFVLGGPAADTGLTGRKLAVDLYGPVAHIGGGALSGKDATKVDRSGAYAARWVAKNIVAAGLAKRCEVQIAYAIGKSEPVSIMVDTFGTGVISDNHIEAAVKEVFDLTPAAMIRDLCLDKPIYSELARYGHMGRTDLCAPWEVANRRCALLMAALRQEKQ